MVMGKLNSDTLLAAILLTLLRVSKIVLMAAILSQDQVAYAKPLLVFKLDTSTIFSSTLYLLLVATATPPLPPPDTPMATCKTGAGLAKMVASTPVDAVLMPERSDTVTLMAYVPADNVPEGKTRRELVSNRLVAAEEDAVNVGKPAQALPKEAETEKQDHT